MSVAWVQWTGADVIGVKRAKSFASSFRLRCSNNHVIGVGGPALLSAGVACTMITVITTAALLSRVFCTFLGIWWDSDWRTLCKMAGTLWKWSNCSSFHSVCVCIRTSSCFPLTHHHPSSVHSKAASTHCNLRYVVVVSGQLHAPAARPPPPPPTTYEKKNTGTQCIGGDGTLPLPVSFSLVVRKKSYTCRNNEPWPSSLLPLTLLSEISWLIRYRCSSF
jgi:hypothetical protein